MLLTSLVVWEAARDASAPPVAFAGHSLGQVTALIAVGRHDPRGRRAASRPAGPSSPRPRPTPTRAGWPRCSARPSRPREDACTAAPDACWLANDNAPGQVVIAGTPDGLDAGIAAAKELGVRKAMPLNVGGAFHTPLMQDAADGARAGARRRRRCTTPTAPVVVERRRARRTPTATGGASRSARHVAVPVRWREVQLTLAGLGATTLLEVGHGSMLAALAKRTMPDVTVTGLATPEDVATRADRERPVSDVGDGRGRRLGRRGPRRRPDQRRPRGPRRHDRRVDRRAHRHPRTPDRGARRDDRVSLAIDRRAARRSSGPGSTPDAIDLLVLATATPEQPIPHTGAFVGEGIGLRCGSFDLGAGCAGFVYALVAGASMLTAGGLDHVLVVGAETLSRIVDPARPRRPASSSATARPRVVLERGGRRRRPRAARLGPRLRRLGHRAARDPGRRQPACRRPPRRSPPGDHYLRMAGQEVFRRAVRVVVDSALATLGARRGRRRGTSTGSSPTRPTLRIIERRAPAARDPEREDDREHRALRQHVRRVDPARARRGRGATGGCSPATSCSSPGFGAGMTWASALLRWGTP